MSNIRVKCNLEYQTTLHGAQGSSPVFAPHRGHLVTADTLSGVHAIDFGDYFKQAWQYRNGSNPLAPEIPGTPAYAPDGNRLAYGDSYGRTRLLDANTGKPIWEYRTYHEITAQPTFSPDGKYFILGDHKGVVRCFKANGDKPEIVWEKEFAQPFEGATFTPNGKILMGGSKQAYHLDEHGKIFVRRKPNGHVGAIPIAGSTHFLSLLDLKSGSPLRRYPTSGRVTSQPALLTDTLAVYGAGKRVHALDLKTGKEPWYSPTFGFVNYVIPSPDKESVVAGCTDGFLYALTKEGKHRWEETKSVDGKEEEVPAPIYTGEKNPYPPAFSRDGRLLAFVTKMPGKEGFYFSVNEAASGKQLATYAMEGGASSSVAASPWEDLFSVVSSDGLLHVFKYRIENPIKNPEIPNQLQGRKLFVA